MPEIVLHNLTADELINCWPYTVPPAAESEWADLSAPVKASALLLAIATLRALVANTVGGCPVTVRPRRSECCRWDRTWRTYSVTGPDGLSGSSFWPVLSSGDWLNLGDGCSVCSPRDGLRISPYIGGVIAVTIDGTDLPTDAYEFTEGLLYRVDGTPWPAIIPGSDAFTITYWPNRRPGALGALAAGALAVEYARASVGSGACRLPARATQVVRNNVSVTLTTDLFTNGLTGITEADAFIRAVNPYALRTAPTVWSPDLMPTT